MIKYLAFLLISSSALATYTPYNYIADFFTQVPAGVNASHELETILSSDSNVCKETGGNLAEIVSLLEAGIPVTVPNPLPVSGTVGINNFPSSQDVVVTNTVPVTGTFYQATQPVSIVSLPLPTNASQETGGHLASIDSKLTNPLPVSGTVAVTGPIGVTQSTSPWVDNIAQFGGSNVVTGPGTSGAGIPRVTVSSDSSITANAGTNLNTSALNLESTQSAFKSANHTDLSAINTTLGTPFQAGGSIGNTSFGATQATAANLNATVVGTAGVALATSANQTNGSQKSQIVDGSGNVYGPAQVISGINYQPVVLAASGATGSAVPARTIQIGGVNPSGNLATINSDALGNLFNDQVGTPASYVSYVSYPSANLTTGSYTTIIPSTATRIDSEAVMDTSGGPWYFSWAASCGALSNTSNTMIIPPGGGGFALYIPSGSCIGAKALGSNITAGNVYMTLFQ